MPDGPRKLVWVPVAHAAVDLGSLGGAAQSARAATGGAAAVRAVTAAVEQSWRSVRTALVNLRLPMKRVRMYQDGLPVPEAGVELAAVVRDLAAAGSPNFKLLAELAAQGGTLTGTESLELLVEERELARRAFQPAPGEAPLEPAELARLQADLTARRDAFIAGRVAATLAAGEVGLIFLGAAHSLDGRLPPDVAVTRLRYPNMPTAGTSPAR